MSSYRSLHRQEILPGTAIWDIATAPLLSSNHATSVANTAVSSATHWRFLTATSDGIVRLYSAAEASLDAKQDVLDASALSVTLTHVLLGPSQTYPVTGRVLGCTQVSVARNYVGDDDDAGNLVVASLELPGTVRIWELDERMDDRLPRTTPDLTDENDSPSQIRALHEFTVPNATGTTLCLCPPRLQGVGGDVVIAVGCLDGTVALVATGLWTPQRVDHAGKSKEPTKAGTVLDSWGSQGSAVPLCFTWHPVQPQTLAVGREDGIVDVLTDSRKSQHRFTQHENPVRGVAFTDDGHLLVAGSDDGFLTIWDFSRPVPALVHHVTMAHRSMILKATPLDHRRYVTTGADRQLHVWNVGQMSTGPVHTFQTDHSVWCTERVVRGASRLVTGSDTGWLQVYSLAK
jgi:WD40 repeat protein